MNSCTREGVDRICSGDEISVCTRFGDNCLHYSQSQPCGGALVCKQEGNTPASCQSAVTCTNACVLGARVCAPLGDLVQTCVENGAGCAVYDSGVACPTGERCEAGECVAQTTPCENDCPSDGLATCVLGAVRTCGQFDSDSCLDLSPAQACAAGQACVDGACVESCETECSQVGATQCAALVGDAVETCQDLGRGCLRWSDPVSCATGERCDTGTCVEATTPCTDECSTSGESVCESGAVRTCGQHDSDSCLELNSGTPCGSLEVCQSGACEQVASPTVVINELRYDSPSFDDADGNLLFVELAGPPGTDLANFAIVPIDGNSGSAGAEIALSGSIPSDGIFLITRDNADAALLAESDLTSATFDPQNGNKSGAPNADAVQLRFGSEVVDAVGFGLGDGNAFGEGNAAPDTSDSESLTRDSSHGDTDDNATDFTLTDTPTPGT